ncbi:uncharacterized protein [Neodiprion pinetum]|uniref:Uncharacterized protein LOC107221506 isoform X1 n=2 Tax=Neodiprion lecontei TaxID=441921 RepID=A0ABM3GB45_NEOLC|nr:uncharacterized protein LOC124220612 isoform X1 [Neodiprion pinetum]XP_046485727.1 uncharacterized protein LOC124220612 isoform X1 [Neodiprion pinetum]XP_046485728.1 uncharacterized protein LOC124220612 isoform X1 [Neodiprion pinetum]XP_046485730.1 uncharacterized protein LOC124220612 isoform X1 [Neodiprion pinetum]XP_046485731.1 uncharacterized protein LOC124220612 isoform X1 [Neodiprion pinetum]XP_046597490.1 uncharacterized protein LOC107221506 isoform X1 [Neodiprion lecontei]XP_0465974
MGKSGHKGHGRYWLSVKPPSRKRKFRERRNRLKAHAVALSTVRQDNVHLVNKQVANECNISGTAPQSSESADLKFELDLYDQNIMDNQLKDVVARETVVNRIDDAYMVVMEEEPQEQATHQREKTSRKYTHGAEMQQGTDETGDIRSRLHDNNIWQVDNSCDGSFTDFIVKPAHVDEADIQNPGTRYTIDLKYMLSELHREFDYHNSIYNCNFDSLHYVLTKHVGLTTKFLFECKMCSTRAYISAEPVEAKNLSISESIVATTNSTGIEYSQLIEILNSTNVQFMTEWQTQDTEVSNFEKAAEAEMKVAGKEEKRLAILRGDMTNGVPYIPVVANGTWIKRPHRSGKHDSLSGLSVIVGFHTQKVLFAAVRNKYCTACNVAERKNEIPKEHQCFKNEESNQSSSNIESSAIAEGFIRSLEMHGLVYSALIVDGDSSVYKKILECNPYDDYYVKKIECTTHLLQNLTTKIKEIAKTKLKSDSKTKMKESSEATKAIGEWRKVIQGSTLRICTAVVKASQYHMTQDISLSDKVERLRKDMVNIPNHVFGEHTRCAGLGYFCDGIPKEGEKNNVPVLTEIGLFDRIFEAITHLNWHAESLLYNVTRSTMQS